MKNYNPKNNPITESDDNSIYVDLEQTANKLNVIGAKEVKQFTAILQKYKTGKAQTERRIIASENWWKLRNSVEEQKVSNIGADGGFRSASAWLHNVIVSKHADAMAAYPEPNILPREESDQQEARTLSAIVPCVMEQNNFEQTYNDTMWQKLKTGTGAYKVVWDTGKLNGLGDISIERANLLNLYWEPGVTNVQDSEYFFHTELQSKELLRQRYPAELKNRLKTSTFLSSKFLYDDAVDTTDKATVIDVYYHKYVNGKKTLQYCKYVEDVVLYATENDPHLAATGLYDHGKFPYVFDVLFPIEGSPCGYGFVDLCKNPQTTIDLLNTSFVKNAMVGATPRYFSRGDGSVNEAEFLDLSNPIVHTNNPLDETHLRRIEHNSLDGNYIGVLDRMIQELRETSGNTEASTGATPSGVTAASAIAALQEASGKGSRDSTQGTYRAYSEIVTLCIELIRQFYEMPRKFRITGQYGDYQFVSYNNAHLKPQSMGMIGLDEAFRLPVFDIKVSAQKANVYTKVSQNELAIQLFQMGFFNQNMTDQAIMCLDIMDFEGKEAIKQKIVQNGTLREKLIHYMQMCLLLAKEYRPQMVPGLAQNIMQVMGGGAAAGTTMGTRTASLPESDNVAGLKADEHAFVEAARENAEQAGQPTGGKVVADR